MSSEETQTAAPAVKVKAEGRKKSPPVTPTAHEQVPEDAAKTAFGNVLRNY